MALYPVSYFNGTGRNGLGALTKGTQQTGGDFNCKGNYCYAIGQANLLLFMTLQAALNAAATARGVPTQIKAEGNLGPETVALAKAIVRASTAAHFPVLFGLGVITPETLSINARELTTDLENLGQLNIQPKSKTIFSRLQDNLKNLVAAQPASPPPKNMPGSGSGGSIAPNPGVVPTPTPGLPGSGLTPDPGSGLTPQPGSGFVPQPGAYPPDFFPPAAPKGLSLGVKIGLGAGLLGLIGGLVWWLRRRGK